MMGARLVFTSFLFFLISCSSRSVVTKDDAILAGQKFVKEHPVYSRSAINLNDVSVYQSKEHFVVRFSPKKGFMGGAPTLSIRKYDGQVTLVESSQ